MSSLFANRRWLPFTLIILLAIGLRLINLGGRALWYDEAFAVLFAEKGLSAMLYGTLTPVAGGAADIHPLLYYSTLDVWMHFFGESAFTVRLLSVIYGVATVAVIYLLAKTLFDERTGLIAALITAIAPFHVQYSQETRMYALLGLFLMATSWCFVKAWRSDNARTVDASWWVKWRYWLGFGLFAGLAMYTQQLAAFYLVAIGLIPFLARRRQQMIGVVVGAITAAVVYLPWLVNLPGQLHKVQSYYWLDKPSIATPLLTIRSFLVVSLDFPSPASMIAFLASLFVILLLIVQVVMWVRQPRNRSKRRPIVFVLWLAAAPPLLMWIVSQVQPVYLERSLLPSALMLYVGLAWLFTRSGMPKAISGVVAVLGLVMVGIGLYYQYTIATFPNSPYQTAGVYIQQNWQEGDVVVHENKLTALPVIFYQRDLPQYFIGDKAGSSDDTLALPTQKALNISADACVQTASHGSQRVWWVVYDFAKAQYAAAKRPELDEAEGWLNSHYTLASTQKFNDLDVVLYTNPHGDLGGACQP
ncbi:MAG: glycosyltransferase family 39 protein [Anaerolineae bacterium]|nr:glycosyltransferase family 39 protein [Anaerolineae bacterium]